LPIRTAQIAPDYLKDDDYRAALRVSALEDSLAHYSRMFGRKFSPIDEAVAFIDGFPSIEKAVQALKDPSRLFVDSDWSEPIPEQLDRYEGTPQGPEDSGRSEIQSR
jgi:hypothetical protein